jgi:1-acyl-sn-glycerol-3-phosphate acyltransferase
MFEKWSFWYAIFRPYFYFTFWLFHRKIVVTGKENIPLDKPLIFAPNHPNALHDDLAIVYSTPHQVVWLGRADIHKSRFDRPFLRFLKIIPVYRIRDGKESLGNNDTTFRTAVKVLQHNQAIAIYPEAENSLFRSMVPHKKAIARVVFLGGELTDFSLDTRIVPTGLYFDQSHNFGRRLVVAYGSPICVKDYYPLYRENPHKANIALRNDLEAAIRKLVLDYRKPENAKGFETARSICTPDLLKNKGWSDNLLNRFILARELAGYMERMEVENPEKAKQLIQRSLYLDKQVNTTGLRHWLVNKTEEKPYKIFMNGIYLLLTFPLFVFGFLFNAIPWFTVNSLVKKKVKNEIFNGTVSFTIGFLLFPLIYLLQMGIIMPFLPHWYWGFLLLLLFPLAGKTAHSWYILLLKTRGRWRWLHIKRTKSALYHAIHQAKQEILALISH